MKITKTEPGTLTDYNLQSFQRQTRDTLLRV